MFSTWANTCLLSLLPALCSHAKPMPEASVPSHRLYHQDPHDVRHPSYPSPSCWPSGLRGFDIGPVISPNGGLRDFCTTQTDSISAFSQGPIYADYSAGEGAKIRFSLSWDTSGTCPTNRTTHSPSDHHGKACETIFRDIVLGCKFSQYPLGFPCMELGC